MGRLWQHKDFMRLWVSQTIEAVGGEVTNLALPTVAILLLNAGAMDMGILNGLQLLPVPILGIFVGVWADRWRRRPMMIIANLGWMLTLAWVPLAFIFRVLQLHQLFIVATLVGIFTVFYDVANQSYLPSLIEREHLIEGNSKIQTTQSGAQVVGPALAGFLIKILGAAQAFAVEVFSLLCSTLLIFSIRKPEAPLPSNVERNFARELKEGASIVFSNPILRSITTCTAILNFGSGIYFAVVYLFLYHQLNLSPETVGLIFTLGAVGFVIGALSASKAASLLGLGPALAISIILNGVGLLLIPFTVYGPTIPRVALFLMLSSIGIPIYNINQVSLRQAITPDHIQGRMNATVRSIIRGTIPVGSFIGGFLGAQFGIVSTLIVGALISTVGVIFLFVKPIRTLREIPALEAAQAQIKEFGPPTSQGTTESVQKELEAPKQGELGKKPTEAETTGKPRHGFWESLRMQLSRLPRRPQSPYASCRRCGYPIRQAGRFCSGCGTDFGALICPCGRQLSRDDKYCDRCGRKRELS